LEKIFIIGITGFIGQHLSEELKKSEHILIKGLTRKSYSELKQRHKKIEYIKGNLFNLELIAEHIEQDSIVINLAYLSDHTTDENQQSINNLLDICINKKIKKFIQCSTAVVAGRVKSDIITEQTKCHPLNEYEKIKYQIEQILIEKAHKQFPVTILRPTAVFGENGKNLVKLADEIERGNCFLNYLKTCLYQKRKMNLAAIDNVVAALKFLINFEQRSKKEIFIISDDDNENNNYQYIKTFLSLRLKSNCSNLPFIPFPVIFLSLLQRLFRKSSINPLQIFSNQKLVQAGFEKPVTLDEALEKFTEWYQTRETKETKISL
jgi:nucleoside-diphosphate-sugar epimerase